MLAGVAGAWFIASHVRRGSAPSRRDCGRGRQKLAPGDNLGVEGPAMLLSNHGLVLVALGRAGPALTLRQIGDLVGVQERAVFRIVGELEEAGYLLSHKIGRRKLYEIVPDALLHHPILGGVTVGEMLGGVLARGVVWPPEGLTGPPPVVS